MISSISNSSSQILQTSLTNQKTQNRQGKTPDATEAFNSMDTDGDGAVTKAEFTTAMEKMQDSQGANPPPPPPDGGMPPEKPEEVFAKIDTDSDGQVSLEELKADFESRKPDQAAATANSGPDLDELFAKLDSNSDGQIGETEFTKLLEKMNQTRDQQIGTIYGDTSSSSSSSTTSLLGYA